MLIILTTMTVEDSTVCGIGGIVKKNEAVEEGVLLAMAESLVHRGPDGQGIYADGPVGLVHRRLSIIDLSSAGNQPMSNEEGTLWIVFNGEIYDTHLLRAQLPSYPEYRGTSDTEVLLRAYEYWGEECLHKLNGMFAFAIYDTKKKNIFIARDRFGIKPLYYYRLENQFAFASEIKTLFAAGLKPDFTPIAMIDFAFTGFTKNDRHLCRHVRRLAPGCFLRYSLTNHEMESHQYYTPRPDWSWCDKLGDKEEDWMAQYEELLSTSVRRRLVSDVPLGSYCSGGVDSSGLTALAAQMKPKMAAFNVSTPDDPINDEGPIAQKVAKHLDVNLHTLNLNRELFIKAFVETVFILEYPLSFVNTVPLYLISKMAKDLGVTVLLSGEGADETLGGYVDRFRSNAVYRIAQSKGRIFGKMFSLATTLLNKVNSKFGLPPFVLENYDVGFHDLLIGNNRAYHDMQAALDEYQRYDNSLDRLLAAELLTQIKNYLIVILHRTDRASMAAGVEARVPFLDHTVVEYALAMPPKFKCGVNGLRPEGKSIWKKIVANHVPSEICYSPKKGFTVPPSYYIGRWPKSWLHEGFVAKEFSISSEEIVTWSEMQKNQNVAWILSLEVWGQLFIQGRNREDVSAELIQFLAN